MIFFSCNVHKTEKEQNELQTSEDTGKNVCRYSLYIVYLVKYLAHIWVSILNTNT